MTTLIQGGHNYSEICISVKTSRRTQKNDIYLAIEKSGLANIGTDLGQFLGSKVGNETGVMLRGRGPHKPEFFKDFVRKYSLMKYTDLIEYKIVGDTKTSLMLCIFLKLKSGDIITAGQYMNYQTFSNLQVRRLLKNYFPSTHIDLKDTSAEKKHLYQSVSIVLFWCSEKPPTFSSNLKDVTR